MAKKKVKDLGGGAFLLEDGSYAVQGKDGVLRTVSRWLFPFRNGGGAKLNHTDRGSTERRVTGR